MTATEITLDQVHSGMVVAGPGTPNAGTAYVPEMSNVLAEIRPDNSLLKLALPAEPENLVVAPYGTKDAGFVFVKLKAGVVVLKPDGSLTSLAISDPNDIAVAPAGTARAGDLFVTSVSSGTLYEVDASTLSVRTIETDLFPATIVMAPAGTDSAGELYLVPGGRTGGDGAAAARIAVVSKERAVSYVPLASAGDDISLAAVSPKDTPTAGTVYVADATNGNVYEIHPDHRVTTVRVDPAGDVGFETLEVASSGSANAGVAYIDEGDGGHVFAIETNGSVRSVSTLAQVHLLAIAPTGTPNAGTLYLSEGKTEVQVVKPDGKTTNLAGLTYDAVSATVDVVVQLELVRVRAQADRVDLVGALVVDPGLDEVLGEHAALEQVVVVGLERVEHLGQRARHLRDVGGLVRRQLVEVLVDRRRRLDLVLDAVEAGHQHRREREVRVARRVRAAELDALGLRVRAGDRDADAGGAVARRVDQVDRRLVARHQAVVGVDRRVGEREQRRRVLEQAADVPARHVGQAAVAELVVEQRLAVLPQRLVAVHARAVVAEERLGHEGDGLAVRAQATFLMTYLNFIRSSAACSSVSKR
jgi:hypothetical protein